MILEIIFWLSVILVIHSYVFYPLMLSVFSLGKKNNEIIYQDEDEWPVVSVIISAYNEESVIEEKIRSVFDTTYNPGKLEVLVGSDYSDDQTVPILKALQEEFPALKVRDYKERRGKQNVVNDLVGEASGTVLVLTDANVIFDRSMLRNLVRHFKNERIGLVDTRMVNRGMKQEGISYQEKAYISREVGIKNKEGRLWGAMMGPFGGCYAIRKMDYRKVPSNYLVDDFYINMVIFRKEKRAINDLDALVYEEIPSRLSIEFRRKMRIGTGNWQNLRTFSDLLFHPRYGFAFWSHKVLRWTGPFLLIISLLMSALLVNVHWIYRAAFFAQFLLLLIPLADLMLMKLKIYIKPVRLLTHFYAMNLALLIGFFRSLRTIRSGVWERTARG